MLGSYSIEQSTCFWICEIINVKLWTFTAVQFGGFWHVSALKQRVQMCWVCGSMETKALYLFSKNIYIFENSEEF